MSIETCECCGEKFNDHGVSGYILCDDCCPIDNPLKPTKKWTIEDLPFWENKVTGNLLQDFVNEHQPWNEERRNAFRQNLVDLLNLAQIKEPGEVK